MKKVVFLLFLLVAYFGVGQTQDSTSYWSRLKKGFFWSNSDDGFYVGSSVGIENYGISLGGEFKYYSASENGLPFVSRSIYLSYRKGLQDFRHDLPQNIIGIGVYFSFIRFEYSFHFGDKAPFHKFTPKIGYDWGNVSVFYGYDLSLMNRKMPMYMNHSISINYSLFFPK